MGENEALPTNEALGIFIFPLGTVQKYWQTWATKSYDISQSDSDHKQRWQSTALYETAASSRSSVLSAAADIRYLVFCAATDIWLRRIVDCLPFAIVSRS
jgi:hypothetical protein